MDSAPVSSAGFSGLREGATSPVKDYGTIAAIFVCYGMAAVTAVARIIMYLKVRSLGADEAMLVESIVSRDFHSLLASPLASGQTAPALYLCAVKLLGALTCYSEGGLRVFSLFMFFGALVVAYLLLTRAFKTGKMWTAFAICAMAMLGPYIRYSNELKPYMGDVFFTLAVLLLYHEYCGGKIKLPLLAAACCLAVLFSTPALFFVASIFAGEFLFSVIEKDRKRIIHALCAGLGVLAFFIAYYMWWLRPADSPYMAAYWANNRFVVWPPNMLTLKHDLKLVYDIIGLVGFLQLPFVCAGFIVSITRKDKITFVALISLLLLLIASSMGKYPMTTRLWLFIYALNILYMIVCFESAGGLSFKAGGLRLNLKPLFALVSLGLVLSSGLKFLRYVGSGPYIDAQEANPLIAYVRKTIKPQESLYAYAPGVFVVKYKNGYNTNRIGNVEKDNIIWGGDMMEWWGGVNPDPYIPLANDPARGLERGGGEFDKIVAAKRAYLLFYHVGVPEKIEKGLNILASMGYLHKVAEFHKTPLYYFTTDSKDPKRNETFDFGR